jgi:acetylglutamate kinase
MLTGNRVADGSRQLTPTVCGLESLVSLSRMSSAHSRCARSDLLATRIDFCRESRATNHLFDKLSTTSRRAHGNSVISILDGEQTTVNEAIRKADVLLEALEWIRHFRGRFVVIKLGGSALDDPQAVQRCLTDVIFMESVGMKPILVHGGGKAISLAMTESGIEPQFIRGRRVTDKATMEIVSRILGGEVCQSLVQRIRDQGGQAEPVNSPERQCLYAERLTLPDDSGADLGFVGKVVDVNRELLTELTDASAIPVIPSIGIEAGGQALNINADTAAAAVARCMGAEKLMFLSDVPGIFADRQDSSSLISHLDSARCRQLVADGTIDQGMLPKVDAALEALDFGVKKVHIVDACTPHSMLLEIYSNTGIGTEIVG